MPNRLKKPETDHGVLPHTRSTGSGVADVPKQPKGGSGSQRAIAHYEPNRIHRSHYLRFGAFPTGQTETLRASVIRTCAGPSGGRERPASLAECAKTPRYPAARGDSLPEGVFPSVRPQRAKRTGPIIRLQFAPTSPVTLVRRRPSGHPAEGKTASTTYKT